MVLKKIFDGVFDEEVHLAFLKFGRGEYKDKFLLEGKRQSKGWAIKSGPEFANFFVRQCLENINGEVKVSGVIVSTRDLRNELLLDFEKVSNFKGVRKHKLDTEVDSGKLREVIDAHPRTFFALSFSGNDFALKIKADAPMKDKPGKTDEESPKATFCSLKTIDKNLVNELFFDCGDFKEAKINHSIRIDDIIYPKDMDNLSPAEVREKSKKKGVLIRTATVDGVEKKSEKSFVV